MFGLFTLGRMLASMTNLTFDQWFPTMVGVSYYQDHDKVADACIAQALHIKETAEQGGPNWISDTFNTANGSYNVMHDSLFDDINTWVHNSIVEYCKQLNIRSNIRNTGSWLNVYTKGDYQEFHDHAGSHISAIYCLQADNNSSKIYFKSPRSSLFQIDAELNQFNSKSVVYDSEPGKLLIFQSDLEHAVGQLKTDNTRISIAYNYEQFSLGF